MQFSLSAYEKKAFERIGRQLGVKTLSDWYLFTADDISANGGSSLLKKSGNSCSQLASLMYPHHSWNISRFDEHISPKRFASGFSGDNQKLFDRMEKLGEQLGIKRREDWYRISTAVIGESSNGSKMLSKFGGSRTKLLQNAYPDYEWVLCRFEPPPFGYWGNNELLKKDLELVGKILGVTERKEWYWIADKDVKFGGGGRLIEKFGSLKNVLELVYPGDDWESSKFDKNHWDDITAQKNRLDSIGILLGVNELSDWYSLTEHETREVGGGCLLARYEGSLVKLLSSIYRNHSWELTRFKSLSKSFWKISPNENGPEFIHWLGDQLSVKQLDDWYRISSDQITQKAPPSVFSKQPLEKWLQGAYPSHPWDIGKLKSKGGIKKTSQRRLALVVQELFPTSGSQH